MECYGPRWSLNRWVFRLRRKVGSESAVLNALGSPFQSLGARREKSLGRVERWPGCFREGSASFPVLADLSEREGL